VARSARFRPSWAADARYDAGGPRFGSSVTLSVHSDDPGLTGVSIAGDAIAVSKGDTETSV
jgi:hypothetical protein